MPMRPRVALALAASVAALAAGGCGGGDPGEAAAGTLPAPAGTPPAALRGVTVYAASSLTEVLPAMAPHVRFGFGGSDTLAFQIRQGAPADVFASASPRWTAQLHAAGLVGRPRVFARNALVVITPRDNPAGIRSVTDLTTPGIRLVVGDAGVPVGAYTREVLRRLGLGTALRHVVSEEPDVKGVVAKVALGEADAGIVYRTDVRPVRDRVLAIPVPRVADPGVAYTVAVTRSARDPASARAFVRYLTGPAGRRWLAAYGFRAP